MKKTTAVKITVWTVVLAAAAVGIWLMVRPSGSGDITLQTAPVTRGVTLESDLQEAEAQLASSKTEYEYRMKEYLRTKKLYDKELVSDAEYDEALYLYETAKNTYAQRQASIVGIRRNLGYATITSPIDGVVISRAVEEGQTVAAGFETPTLFTIANDLTDMQVIADVDEADIGCVQEGQRVDFTVDAYPDDIFQGLVKDLKLKPGLTANVTIYTMERDNVCCVPSKALRFVPDGGLLKALGYNLGVDDQTWGTAADGTVCWVVSGDQLVPRKIIIGQSDGEKTEVVSGLRDGETVAVGLQMAPVMPDRFPQQERSPFMPGPPR